MTEGLGPVSAEVARHVRLLVDLGVPPAVVTEVTGCPEALVIPVAREEGHEETLRGDLALVAVADRARMQAYSEPGPAEVEEVAQWLAEQSDHPRYCQVPEGWRTILASTADVEVAYAAAVRRLGTLPGLRAGQQGDSLRAARDVLHKAAKAAEAAGAGAGAGS